MYGRGGQVNDITASPGIGGRGGTPAPKIGGKAVKSEDEYPHDGGERILGKPLKRGGAALSEHDGGRLNIGGKAVKRWWGRERVCQSTTKGNRMESLRDEPEPTRRERGD